MVRMDDVEGPLFCVRDQLAELLQQQVSVPIVLSARFGDGRWNTPFFEWNKAARCLGNLETRSSFRSIVRTACSKL
jgi:hypothetical protein